MVRRHVEAPVADRIRERQAVAAGREHHTGKHSSKGDPIPSDLRQRPHCGDACRAEPTRTAKVPYDEDEVASALLPCSWVGAPAQHPYPAVQARPLDLVVRVESELDRPWHSAQDRFSAWPGRIVDHEEERRHNRTAVHAPLILHCSERTSARPRAADAPPALRPAARQAICLRSRVGQDRRPTSAGVVRHEGRVRWQ